MSVSPSAESAAIISAAPPRRSVATAGAPCRASTPVTTATRPSVCILAPRRASSSVKRKRFWNTFSTNTLVPRALRQAASISGWASVGKPG